MSLKKINSNIKLIETNLAKANDRIHETAVMIARHAEEFRDCTTAQRLVMAMPASMRRSMLILWFATFTPIVTKNDPKWTAKMRKADDKAFVAFDVAAGEAKPFYELAKDKPEADDLTADKANEMIESLIKRLTKRIDDGKVAANDKGAIEARITALKAVAA